MIELKKAREYTSKTLEQAYSDITPLSLQQVEYTMTIADKIVLLMKKNKLTQKVFADKLGKRPSEITKWISGLHNFTIHTLTEICFAFNIKIEDLLRIDNSKNLKPTIPAIKIKSRDITSNSNIEEGIATGKHHVARAHEKHTDKPKNSRLGEKPATRIPASRKVIKRSM